MLIDVLLKWNRWGSNSLASGEPREITASIDHFLHTEDIVVLTGLRRAGKSTILYQIMDRLEAEGIDPKAMLHINFEEPALSANLKLPLLDQLYDTYRSEVYPEGRAYLFLDEIQHIDGWERWARARNESEAIKLFITGSSAKTMSRELATLLTGRHVSFEVYPLSFAELLQFQGINIPEKPWSFAAPPKIQHAMNFLLKWGSLPKVVLAKHDEVRDKLLAQYFDDILLKDIAMRHNIRDMATLRALAVHLMTNTGALISAKRLANIFGVSTVTANAYCNYIQDAFLSELIPIFTLKTAERQRNPQKTHVVDLGIRNRISLSHSIDKGRLIESLVYNRLKQVRNDGIFYWKKRGEIDLLVREGNQVSTMVQVITEGVEDEKILNREIAALEEGLKEFPNAKGMIVTAERHLSKSITNIKNFKIMPLWQLLLGKSE